MRKLEVEIAIDRERYWEKQDSMRKFPYIFLTIYKKQNVHYIFVYIKNIYSTYVILFCISLHIHIYNLCTIYRCLLLE